MTEPRDAAPALPLAVTYAPDVRLVDAVRALVGRVGALAGEPPRAEPFAAAVQQLVTWVTEHRATIAGDVAIRFERDGDRLCGALRWAATGAGPHVPAVDGAATPEVEMACDVSAESEVHCRVACRCS
jgi:hypothetical protein